MTQNARTIYTAGSTNASAIATSAKDKYPNPFCDIASEYMPGDIYEMFRLAEFLWNTMPPFKEVGTKVVRYFLTEPEFEGGGDDEREQCAEVIRDNIGIMSALGAAGDDFMAYGQAFISIIFPFDRFLVCPDCGSQINIKFLDYRFHADSEDPYFEAECPKCKMGKKRFERYDRRSPDKTRVYLKLWSPYEIKITEHPVSGRKEFYLDLSANGSFAAKIRSGDKFMLSDTPWSIVRSCCRGSGGLFKFKDNQLFHLCSPTLSGMAFNGWSIPPLLTSFKLAYYIQMLRRLDEAIVLEHVVPFRIIYPDTPPNMDPLASFSMGTFVAHMQGMIERKRKNITDIQISPFRVGQVLLGGDAKSMSPKDNIKLAMDELLNNSGFPAELYNGTLSWQVMPVALRLFERRWGNLVDGYNSLLAWTVSTIGGHFAWSRDLKAKLRSVTLADDLERKALGLQAAAGGDLSKATAYGPFGYKFEEEQKRVLEEQRMIAKLQQEAEEQDQIQQMTGAPAGGGDPAQQAGYAPTMNDVRDQAQSLAQQLLFQVPEGQRRGQIAKIRQTNPTLHALTLQAMDEMRRQMASQGQSMLMEQNRQAAAAGQPTKTASELPSVIATGMLIQSEAEYSGKELRKLARDINIPGVRSAFHFIHGMMTGREGVL